MVKNSGGNKCKRGAQKHMAGSYTRHIVEKNHAEPCEIYAVVVKLYGGSNCEVQCEDGITRMCIIRNKFRGRGKRDNFLLTGVWVLVGTRDWEIKHNGKPPNCDLLYVYSEDEKNKLKANSLGNWSALYLSTCDGTAEEQDHQDDIIFEDSTLDNDLMKQLQEQCSSGDNTCVHDVIDIDDI